MSRDIEPDGNGFHIAERIKMNQAEIDALIAKHSEWTSQGSAIVDGHRRAFASELASAIYAGMHSASRSDSRRALELAALAHAGETGAHGFSLPIPNTTPKLFVAMGEKDQLAKMFSERGGVKGHELDGRYVAELIRRMENYCDTLAPPMARGLMSEAVRAIMRRPALTEQQRSDLEFAINLAERSAHDGEAAISRLRAMLSTPLKTFENLHKASTYRDTPENDARIRCAREFYRLFCVDSETTGSAALDQLEVKGLVSATDEDNGVVTLTFDSEESAQKFILGSEPTVERTEVFDSHIQIVPHVRQSSVTPVEKSSGSWTSEWVNEPPRMPWETHSSDTATPENGVVAWMTDGVGNGPRRVISDETKKAMPRAVTAPYVVALVRKDSVSDRETQS